MKMIVRKNILQDKKQFCLHLQDKKQFYMRGLGQKTVYVSENCFLSMCDEKKLFFVQNAIKKLFLVARSKKYVNKSSISTQKKRNTDGVKRSRRRKYTSMEDAAAHDTWY